MLGVSISIPEAFGHVAGERVADRPGGHDLLDVIHSTVHGFLPGTAVLAERMELSRDTLQQKANRNNTQHVFHPHQLMDLMRQTGNAAVLHCMAEQLGYSLTQSMPDQAGGDPVQAFLQLQVALADFSRAVAEPLEAGGDVTPNAMRRATAMAGNVHTAIGAVLAAMRAGMRALPPLEGGAP